VKAAAYARYSTANQTENSIAAQLDGIIKFCQSNGYTITNTYIDEAQTGTNINRQGFINLVDGAKQRLFDAVVIFDISRDSRDVAD
jgi:site-specific DNA recombinase